MNRFFLSTLPPLSLIVTACDRPPVQRIDLEETQSAASLALNPAPDSEGAAWHVSADGKGIDFGQEKLPPLLTLHCVLAKDTPPQLAVIRHAQSQPGAKALFAVLGNGITARLKLDATLSKTDGWRWEGLYPADAVELDVFTGQRNIEATLPGAGTLKIAGSPLPREFLGWCRRGGLAEPQKISSPPPAP
ncbi:hypothetical protein [Altererythrobacter fulvus]|uniref:hypothetical protein n=1 Tax=Caenibius fulvus TaxID=2126012 RepID=UPI00301AAB93